MTFKQLNQKYLAPGAQTLMIFGIISLCQPWSNFLHRYGLIMTIIGLIGASLGLLVGLGAFWVNMIYPWDFSSYTEMAELVDFDYSELIYPALIWGNVIRAAIGIFVFTLLAAIYPAAKAASLKPVDALRHV